MKTTFQKSFLVSLILLLSSGFLVVIAEFMQSNVHATPESYARKAEKNLRSLEEKMMVSLGKVEEITADSAFHKYFIHHGFQELGFSFFYIEHEAITKWSDNETEISSRMADTCKTNSLIHLNNGWYELFIRKGGDKEIIGLILIRKEYAYENQYLVNEFNPELGLPEGCELITVGKENYPVIRSMSNEPLFAIRFSNSSDESSDFSARSWLYIFSFMLFLLGVFTAAKTFSKISSIGALLVIPVVALARTWMIQLHMPDEFYNTEFFSPKLYASSYYFNSLGDLFINAMMLLCFSAIIYSVFGNKTFHSRRKLSSMLAKSTGMTLLFLLSLPLDNLVRGLILNSKISFDVINVFSMNEYSLAGILVIAALLSAYFLMTLALIRFFSADKENKSFYSAVFISFIFFSIIYFFLIPTESSFFGSPVLLAATVALMVVLLRKRKETGIRLNFLLGITMLFSVYASFLIWNMNEKKEKENRKLLAQKIEVGRDQVAEYLFAETGSKIQSDEIIQRQFMDTVRVQELVSKRLMQFYFNGYWSKFNISISCFNMHEMPFDSLQMILPLDTLKRKITDDENPDETPQIHYLGGESDQQEYAAIIPVRSNTLPDFIRGYIEVVFVPKLFQTGEGLPELFVSNKVAFNKELSNYSYARYKNDSLLSQSGEFAYYFSVAPFHPTQQEYAFLDLDGFNHLVHRVSANSYIIVSKSKDNNLILLTLFSYLFSIFSLLLLICYLCWWLLNRQVEFQFSLTRRIQFSVVMLVILSFLLTGGGTMYYMVHKSDVNKDKSINEKTSSLLTLMEKELSDAMSLRSKLTEEMQASLIRFSGTVNADFNLYTVRGNLYYSSQPKIFEQGILSRKINPDALFEIREKGKTQFVHPESIGKLNYIAAYEPLRNRQGKTIGYLHLPYFEKQNELNKEISSFLSALINIYILLFALAVLVTFFISSRITHPLMLIQEKLSRIRLGSKNELIEYKQRDEIGELVKEYNRMVEELTASAEKLARSEREIAWREMAKQVAHEIKNPLTPMKLSLQHLQRAWEEKGPALDDIFRRISETLVQQIDTLSTIATEFSNFAQMPQAKKEIIDLTKILEVCMELFQEEPNTTITFEDDHEKKLVFADKDQLIRTFSNLFKNAIQSIPSGKHGIINVSISKVNDYFKISIRDNGIGILPEEKSRIFTPSFTTKSGGMGLGLSIVKSIIESSGGSISFESEFQKGTTFQITLPMSNLSN